MTYYSYWYNTSNGNLQQLRVSGDYISGTVKPVYDSLGRTTSKTIDFDVNSADAFYNKLTYDYVTKNGFESGLVSQVTSEVRKSTSSSVISTTTYSYTYDANGNITLITNGSGVIQYKYAYDELGQLIREDNRDKGYSYVYTYDNAGNITSKKRYAFTTGTLGTVQQTYSYAYEDSSWKDLLTSYNGESITYDTIGNPLSIGYKEFTWEGRQLKTYFDSFYNTTTYYYSADGIRTRQESYDTDSGEISRTEYILNGTQIVKETYYYGYGESQYDYEMLSEIYTLVYIYDELGAPIGIKYRTQSYAENVYDCYFFEKNLQGDIIAIYNASGTKIVTYTYDAWGNVTTTLTSGITSGQRTVAYNNPFRYRGYYYDTHLEMYYVQSRYYNPEWGRFINADGFVSTGQGILGYNMFAYCNNNPISYSDSDGNWPRWITKAVAVAAMVVTVGAIITRNIVVAVVSQRIAVVATATYVLQSAHFDMRKQLNSNDTVPKTQKEAEEAGWIGPDSDPPSPSAKCHQYTSINRNNTKFVTKDGHREAIYTSSGDLVLDSRDIGTYNIFPSGGFWGTLGHIGFDILPWVLFGNDDDDPGILVNTFVYIGEEIEKLCG